MCAAIKVADMSGGLLDRALIRSKLGSILMRLGLKVTPCFGVPVPTQNAERIQTTWLFVTLALASSIMRQGHILATLSTHGCCAFYTWPPRSFYKFAALC